MLVAHDSTTLEQLWNQAQAGLIAWADVQAHQAELMPRCANHPDRAAPAIQDGAPVCADCFETLVVARREQKQC